MIDDVAEPLLGDDLSALVDGDGFWYVATPYTKYPGGIDAAFEDACRAAAWLIERNVRVYCPIAHTHPISMHGRIDPLNHDIWLPVDRPLMRAARGLIVCMLPTWRESYGISVEIAEFKAQGKPVYYMEWDK